MISPESRLVVTTRSGPPGAEPAPSRSWMPIKASAWAFLFAVVTILIGQAWSAYVGPVWLKLPILCAGLSALICGLILLVARPSNPLSIYLVIFGVVWYIGILQAIPIEVVYAIGFVFFHTNVIVLAHLALSLPTGRLRGRVEVALFATMYLTFPGIQLLRYLGVRDHIDRQHFGQVTAYSTVWARVGTYTAAPLILIALVLIVRHWRASSSAQRRAYRIFWYAAAGVGVVALVAVAAEFTDRDLPQQLALLGYVVAVTVAPVGVLYGSLAERNGLRDVVELLAAGRDDDLSRMIAVAVGDPGLRLYERAGDRWLDDRGVPVAVHVGPGDWSTLITGPQGSLALMVHDRALAAQPSTVRVCAGLVVTLIARRTAEREREALRRATDIRMVQEQLAERERVQLRLHDQAHHEIRAMNNLVERLRTGPARDAPATLDALAGLVERHAAHLRAFIAEAYPSVLRTEGLLTAVKQLLLTMPLDCRVDIPHRVTWDPDLQAVIYFTISEALANTDRYAHASVVTVKGWQDGGVIIVEIVDNGVGGAAESGTGLGLSRARMRAEMLRGTFQVDSPPGWGTRLRLTLPDVKLPRLTPAEPEEAE